MKKLTHFVFENIKYKPYTMSKVLVPYIFALIEDLVKTPNEKYRNELLALTKTQNGLMYISFDDIHGFNNDMNVLTFRDLDEESLDDNMLEGDPEFDETTDMGIRFVRNLGCIGAVEDGLPIIDIDVRYVKDEKSLKRYEMSIKNTLRHEICHYIQFLKNKKHNRVNTGADCSQEFLDNVDANNTTGSTKGTTWATYQIKFWSYFVSPGETEARINGFDETVEHDYEMLKNKFLKKYKTFDREKFAEFVVYFKRYQNEEIQLVDEEEYINKDIANDTYEDYLKCINDTENSYRQDSFIFAYLNFLDNCKYIPKDVIVLPSKRNFVLAIRTEEEFNDFKERLIKKANEYLDQYRQDLMAVVMQIVDDMGD